MPSSHLILGCPLLLLPAIPPSIRVFFNESTLRMRWPKYWSFSFSIIPSKEIPGLISFRMDWLDVDQSKLWTIPQEMGIPDHHTCLLRNLYAGQEATVRAGHGTTDCFQIGKGVPQYCIYCHPAYVTYIQSSVSSVQSLSCVQFFATLWTAACQASCPSPTLGVYSNSCPLSQ